MKRFLLIKLDDVNLKTLPNKTLEEKKKLAIKDYSFEQFMEYVNLSDDFRDISIEEIHIESYEDNTKDVNTFYERNFKNKNKELRVYLVDIEQTECFFGADDLSDEEFMNIAEQQGTVYTLSGFQNVFNQTDEVNTNNQYVRFIEVEIFDNII